MSGVLDIQADTTTEAEAQAAQQETAVNLQDLPDYLKSPAEEVAGSVTLSVVAVLFFLLATIGPAALNYFYLMPQLAEKEILQATAEERLHKIAADVEVERNRGQEHEKRLEKIQKTVTSPANDQHLDRVTAEIRAVAHTVATDHEDSGGFVTLNAITLSEDGKVVLTGNVDSFLTMADWVEGLESSPYLTGVAFSGASSNGEQGSITVPYSLSMKLEAIKEDKKPAAGTPSAAPVPSLQPLVSSLPPGTPSSSPAPSSSPIPASASSIPSSPT